MLLTLEQKRYYYQCHQQVIFHKYQVNYFQNLILHFTIHQKMQYIKHLNRIINKII